MDFGLRLACSICDLPAGVLGKQQRTTYVFEPLTGMWETRIEFLDPDFSPVQP